ncbi:MAG: universal stress protein [Candidatus Thermoplasmatota archaeon]|nr:universal stress protein [Candidatus Thermoplasmatota archaeon]
MTEEADGGPEKVTRILAAVDGSDASARAVGLAADMARSLQAELMLLHVIELEELPTLIGETEDAHADERAQLVLGMAAKLARARGMDPKVAARRGHPAGQILRFASSYRPQIIVLGTRGMTGSKGILMGSVSSAVSKKAECSVLLVR